MKRGWIWTNQKTQPGPGPGPGPDPGYHYLDFDDLPDNFWGMYDGSYLDTSFVTFPPMLYFGFDKSDITNQNLRSHALYHYNRADDTVYGKKIVGYGIFKLLEDFEAETAGNTQSVAPETWQSGLNFDLITGAKWGGFFFSRGSSLGSYQFRNSYPSETDISLASVSGLNIIPTCDVYVVYYYQNSGSSTNLPITYTIPELATYGQDNDVLGLAQMQWQTSFNQYLAPKFWGWLPGKIQIPDNYYLVTHSSQTRYELSNGEIGECSGVPGGFPSSERGKYRSFNVKMTRSEFNNLIYPGRLNHAYNAITNGMGGLQFLRGNYSSSSSGSPQTFFFGTANSAPSFSTWTGTTRGTTNSDPTEHDIPIYESVNIMIIPKKFSIKNVPLLSRYIQ